MLSIQTASTGESKNIHLSSGLEVSLVKSNNKKYYFLFIYNTYCIEKLVNLPSQHDLITDERIPSVHSFVFRSTSPYSSPKETAFGFIGYS
jgi:hypothetical protein